MIPAARIRPLNDAPRRDGPVVYWMTAARRATGNWALHYAAAEAARIGTGLVVWEGMQLNHPYASHRLHHFVWQGMQDNAAAFARAGIPYVPVMETAPGQAKGLLAKVAKDAAMIVTDDSPAYWLPRFAAAAGRQNVRAVAVDSNGLLPLAAAPKSFARAVDFRRFLQKTLPEHLNVWPLGTPGSGPATVPAALAKWVLPTPDEVAEAPYTCVVPPSPIAGGSTAAKARLGDFVKHRDGYSDARHPDAEAASGLSPYLHFGHVGSQEVAAALLKAEGWTPADLGTETRGQRAGWWGVGEAAEAFLDQLVTWRELGYVAAWRGEGAGWNALPPWAQATLEEHRADPRETTYTAAQLEAAETHDDIWNAAQRQLRDDGVMQNYLRMLWGKNILAWSKTPKAALNVMFDLNDRYALDGRDPNSISGILWCLGKYDRAWPERPVFGKIRYMTSKSTRTKLRLTNYLKNHGP